MPRKKVEKGELRSTSEAGVVESVEKSTDVTVSDNTVPKKKKKGFDEKYIIRDSETAKKRGHNGGIKSGEVRRAQRDARETIRYMLDRMTKSNNVRENLKELGFEKSEYSNMAALHGRLFTMAMGGNLEAYMTLMKMGGYEPEENRRERESIASDARKNKELDAKVDALGAKQDGTSVSVNMNDEDGNTDVVIYMPQIMSEKECEVESDDHDEDIVADEDST